MTRVLSGAFRATPAAAQDVLPVQDLPSQPRCASCHVDAEGSPVSTIDDGKTEPQGANVRSGERRIGSETPTRATCHRAWGNPLPGGAEGWALAPVVMQWAARSAREMYEQLEDPSRNGGSTLAKIADHVGHVPLVVRGWTPGPGRDPAPGTPEAAGAASLAWAAAGAPCP